MKFKDVINEEQEAKFSELTEPEKKKAYKVFLKSGSKDTESGFYKQMYKATFNRKTGEKIES